jgi:hypothetical protein
MPRGIRRRRRGRGFSYQWALPGLRQTVARYLSSDGMTEARALTGDRGGTEEGAA